MEHRQLQKQPVRNIINVYACNCTMKEADWMMQGDSLSTREAMRRRERLYSIGILNKLTKKMKLKGETR